MATSDSPFFREAGAGPGVVCLHSNASSSGQWRALMERLSSSHRVLAPDLHGAGRGPAWPAGRTLWLRDEAALLEPVFERAGDPFTLVGHSYGAAVALVAALAQPRRVRALALYEPTLFSLLDAESTPPNDADGIRGAVSRAETSLAAGDPTTAARHFIDYWMGQGAWERTPDERKEPIASSLANVGGWAHALFNEPTRLEAFTDLDIPVLYLVGETSPASSLGVARLLTRALPRVQRVELEGLGHMAPVTHPDIVNDAICRFLENL